MTLQFAVADTGIGILPDKIGELFQPFVQADASLTRRYGGTGLGLVISNRLARVLGGDIEVTSQLGKGSTFTLTIDAGPLRGARMLQGPPAASAAEEERSSAAPDPMLHGRVLLAEDVPDVYLLLDRILSKMNLEVDVAGDGRAACDMAAAAKAAGRPYDLIFMDIQMPHMNGYEATQWLRRHGWKGPIVAVTAHAMLGDREKCLAAGCDDYLAKPFPAAALRDILARYLTPDTAPAPSVSARDQATAEPVGLLEGGLLDAATVARLVEAFSAELPARVRSIEDAARQRDLNRLAEAAHQLKGTAGIYGFTQISEAARVIHQRATEEDDLQQLQAAVVELAALCRQVCRQDSGGGAPPR